MEVFSNVAKPTEEPIKACRGCLETETTLYELFKTNIYTENDLVQIFSEFTGYTISPSDGYPQYICKLCLYLLRKFVRFRHRCIKAMYLWQQLEAEVGSITPESIKGQDLEQIKHNYGCTDILLNVIDNNTGEIDNIKTEINLMPETSSQNTGVYKYYDDDDIITNVSYDNVILIDQTDDKTIIPQNTRIKEEIIEQTQPKKVKIKKERVTQAKVSKKMSLIKNSDNFFKEIQKLKEINVSNDTSDDEEKLPSGSTSKSKSVKNKKPDRTLKLAKIVINQYKEYVNSKKEKMKEIEEIEALSDGCKTRIEEIKNEIQKGLCRKDTLCNYKLYVKKKLEEAKCYNLEVKFLSKQEVKFALAKKRNSDSFINAVNKCEKCCLVYATAEKLNQHNVSHSVNRGPAVCDVCEMRFKNTSKANYHMNLSHLTKVFCKICGIKVRTQSMYRPHHAWHQGNHELYKCEQCNKQFTIKKQYQMHVANIHGGHLGGPECLLCNDGRGFQSKTGLQAHVHKIHRTNPRCPSCKTVFADDDALTVHSNVTGGCHTGYSFCQKCGANFPNEDVMMTHYNETHRQGYYKCTMCPKQYKSQKFYAKHMNSHSEMPTETTTERVTVGVRERALAGRRKETEKRACHICGKLQSDQRYKIHMRTHTGEKPFPCPVCDKTFNTKQALQTHTATHTGLREFECHLCSKAFVQSQHLRIHMATHTKEKPYKCKDCAKRFRYTSSLREHIRTMHEGLPPRVRKTAKRNKMKPLTEMLKVEVAESNIKQTERSLNSTDICPEYIYEEIHE